MASELILSSGQYVDPILVNRATQLIVNTVRTQRSQWRQPGSLDPRRNVAEECGYPSPYEITPRQFKELYDSEPIAHRVVNVLPSETWKSTPMVYEDEDTDVITEFEESWDALGAQLQEHSWHKQEEGSQIWSYLERLDEMSGIGTFGLLLIGIDDGNDLREPVDGLDERGNVSANRSERRLLFLRVLDESMVQITRYELDPSNPRYGKPTAYHVTLDDPQSTTQGIGSPTSPVLTEVHWHRVIHVADGLGSSEIFGTPRMRPVYRRLYDLQKIDGGSGEMYWKGAFPGYSFETHPQLGGDVEIDEDALKDMVEEWFNGLQRVLTTRGMTVKSISPQVVDPKSQIDCKIEAICIELGVPVRIFKGSERGELASNQDDSTWNERLAGRQRRHVTPNIIMPFVDRLIAMGVLPEPKEYCVEWPDLDALTDAEVMDIATKFVTAITAYIKGGGESLIDPKDLLVRIFRFTEEEAQSILENVVSHLQESHPDMEDQIVPGHVPTKPQPPTPQSPIKMKDGETLVTPIVEQ